ncbi:hypothetical protein FI667_g810, partial [Globisporangium splendens]
MAPSYSGNADTGTAPNSSSSSGGGSGDGSACDSLLAKLDELMDFLQFARLPTAAFTGVVTFMFRASNADKNEIACIRTIDMRNPRMQISNTTLPASDPFLRQVAVVHVSLADFLYMYSGEASAAEIAGMCMSGRVSVPWSSYSKLKAFAECFDFSSEKWDAYYAAQLATPGGSQKSIASSMPQCSKSCCQSSTREEIDADWQLVVDATTTSIRAATAVSATSAPGCSTTGGDWQVVSDCKCSTLPRENREEMEQVFGVHQIDEWLANLWSGHIKRSNDMIQENVKRSFHDLKEMTGKLFVSLEA